MELDDLKVKWKNSTDLPPKVEIRDSLQKRISELERSGRGIRMAFLFELTIVVVLYAMFVSTVWIFGDRVLAYMYKMGFLIGVGFIPALWRIYQSQKWIRSLDYAKDLRSNIRDFVVYYRKTLVIYRWSAYIVSGALLIVFFTDQDFMEHSLTFRAGVAGYIVLTVALTEPYLRVVYGRRAEAFENFLKE